jgi:FtsX-like permease family
MWNDIRYALRTLRRFRLYTLAGSLTLALGIGAASAVFSVSDATLLRALPYRDPDRLVALRTELAGSTATQVLPPSQIELVTWRAGTRLEGQRRFNADPSVLGQTITLGGRAHTIIGVMPAVLLAIVGIYAMTAASVTARTWEASLRVALGARPWRIAAGVIRDASIQVVAGSALGLAAFWALRRLIAGLLFQTSAMDRRVIFASVAGLMLLALSAAALQARRLASVSPVLGLRGPDAADSSVGRQRDAQPRSW